MTARLGTVETKLTVEYKKAVITPSNSSIVIKGSLDTTDKKCEYGKIKTESEGKELTEYRLMTVGMPVFEVNAETTAEDWNKFMQPLVREGATVHCLDKNSDYNGYL